MSYETINKKLATISEVMADGYHFIKLRQLVLEWDALADAGDQRAIEAMTMIEQFHRLCAATKELSRPVDL